MVESWLIYPSLQKVRLSQEYKLNDSRQGIARADQTAYNIIAKCARYVETSFKWLSLQSNQNDPELQNLYTIQVAQLAYLQDEFSALLVQGQFDQDTSKLFRTLQKKTRLGLTQLL